MEKCLIKKIFAVISVLLICTMIFSCEGLESSEQADDRNTMYVVWQSVLYRLDVDSAVLVSLCPDPLCFHEDESCPFWGVRRENAYLRFYGNNIYYLRGRSNDRFSIDARQLCSDNSDNGKYQVLYEAQSGDIASHVANDKYVFFVWSRYDENNKYGCVPMRYDIKTKKVDELTDKVFLDRITTRAIQNDRVYWYDQGKNEHFSTDFDFADKREGDKVPHSNSVMGKYAFELEYIEQAVEEDKNVTPVYKMIRVDRETGEKVTALERFEAYVPIIHGGKIIYPKLGDRKYVGEFLDEGTGTLKPLYDRWGGKYYICNSDGTDERLLCDIGAIGYSIPIDPGFVSDMYGIGDWILIRAQKYPDADGFHDGGYIMINIVTGEAKEVTIL